MWVLSISWYSVEVSVNCLYHTDVYCTSLNRMIVKGLRCSGWEEGKAWGKYNLSFLGELWIAKGCLFGSRDGSRRQPHKNPGIPPGPEEESHQRSWIQNARMFVNINHGSLKNQRQPQVPSRGDSFTWEMSPEYYADVKKCIYEGMRRSPRFLWNTYTWGTQQWRRQRVCAWTEPRLLILVLALPDLPPLDFPHLLLLPANISRICCVWKPIWVFAKLISPPLPAQSVAWPNTPWPSGPWLSLLVSSGAKNCVTQI